LHTSGQKNIKTKGIETIETAAAACHESAAGQKRSRTAGGWDQPRSTGLFKAPVLLQGGKVVKADRSNLAASLDDAVQAILVFQG